MEPVSVVFDVGGTTMRVAAVKNGALDEIHLAPTPKDPAAGLALLIEHAHDSANGAPIVGFAGCIAGVVDGGVVARAPHLPLWNGTRLLEELGRAFGAPGAVFNDAALVGLGEYYYGAGQHAKVLAYVTVSTGVGGARIVEGRVDQGRYNAEIGHQNVDGRTLEEWISGSAIEARYGKHPKDITDERVLNELADILARGLYDNVLHWSPDTVVVGGSMITGKNPIPLERVRHTLQSLVTTIYPDAPRLLKAQLSKLGGLYGGMGYVLSIDHSS